MNYNHTLWIYILLFAIVITCLIIGVYVYRDAKARGMKAGYWTTIAVLTPCLIGLILYVLLRDDERNMKCTACGYPLKADWKVCPVCETPLPEGAPMTFSPLNRDKGIWKITAAAVIIPVLICVLMGTVMMSRINNHVVSGMATYNMTKDDVKNRDLQRWFQECDQKKDDINCYLLWQTAGSEAGSDEKEAYYVIYINENDNLKFEGSQTGFGQENLILKTEKGKNGKGYVMIGVSHYVGTPKPVITIDGQEIQSDQSRADFDLKKIIDDKFDI